MKLVHNFSKGQRYYKQYRGVQTDYPRPIDEPDYWWDENINRWTINPDWKLGGISNTFSPCHSVRAFKRRLKEWSTYLPKGVKFRLIGRYVGQDVIGTIK